MSNIIDASMKNLYNAWNGSTGIPSSPVSLTTIANRSSGQISLGSDFYATGMRFVGGAASYNLKGNSFNQTIAWDLLGTGNYVQRLKKGHSFEISSDDTKVVTPASEYTNPVTDTDTLWDTGDPDGETTIYLIVNGSPGFINVWVGQSWANWSAQLKTTK